jgi:succinate dehydrogenase / fumarate reductase cytochrome b subunit
MSSAPKPRPKYYDLNLAHLPLPGIVSIFHRVSGLALFAMLPLLLWALQRALGSQQGYEQVASLLSHPIAKLALLGLAWLYAHHFWAGLRYLVMDMHWQVGKAQARRSALAVFALGLLTTVLVGWRLW